MTQKNKQLEKKKIKEDRFRLYTIKIDCVQEVEKVQAGEIRKDKMFCVDIKLMGGRGLSFCEPTLKKLFKSIKEELYL